ncbi:hypothetical protein TTHT_0160 [Thermotomaculum hydrothermale]|uniref:YHS domain-containing protein n=1 Tax=Thermotomaculum hydrothermale TaxID=981385 RepID=A0A7R6SXS5_9BACT|nr:YHS domain-containing protein [Thermotomaculum hydrothermale]BBB31801.1 hypothetical protein TTHT_0160 [Thermotomaculum hydrothermale]
MKKLLILTVVLGLIFGITSFAKSDKKLKPQTKCPICKMDINKNLYVDYKGKRIYFGCEGCPAEFMKNPDKYIKQMEEEGIELEKTPANAQKNETYMMNGCWMHTSANNQNSKVKNNKQMYMMDHCRNYMKNWDKKTMMEMHKKMMKMHNFDMSKCTCTAEMMKNGEMCNYCKSMMDKWMSTNQNNQNANSNKVKR